MERQELDEMGVSMYKKLRHAIEEGQKEKALQLVDEFERNRERHCGSLVRWVDVLLTALGERVGDEAVFEAHKTFYQRHLRPGLPGVFDDPEERLRRRVYAWTSSHGTDVNIEEDEDKYILRFRCPSGGALKAGGEFGRTREAHPWSLGVGGMCYYCTHCPTIFELLRIEECGYPNWISFPSEGDQCVQYLYKDPRQVPEEYYRRIGKKKG